MTLRTDVSALYIDPRGPYPKLLADCWDESRDARAYAGPNPVVAHPPCGPWGPMRRRYEGTEHDLAPHALEIVRKLGGVLEHPCGSKLWEAGAMPPPGAGADVFGGRTMSVQQVAWGHTCRKPTWLYVVGVDPWAVARGMRTGGTPTHQIFGSPNSAPGHRHNPNLKAAHAAMRRRTPVLFAEFLILLAASVRPAVSA